MSASLTIHLIVHQDYSHIQKALKSVIENSQQDFPIDVTINTGESPEYQALKQAFPAIHYIVNDSPKGFAANHNHALTLATTDYILLLNDDVELAPNTLETMLDYLEKNPQIGIATPRIINPDGSPQQSVYSFPSLPRMIYKLSGLGHLTREGSEIRRLVIASGLSKFLGAASLSKHQETKIVPVVMGVAMFLRRKTFEEVGGMNEDTMVFGEEYSWQWRMKEAGWQSVLVADVSISHFNVKKDIRGWALAEHRKGMLSFFLRHRPKWQILTLRTAMFLLHGLRWLFNSIFDRQRAEGDWLCMQLALTWNIKEENSGSKYASQAS